MFVFPLAASLVSFIFAIALVRQFVDRRKPYQLAWAAAMASFGIGAAAETMATLGDWTDPLARLYYIFGGTLIVGVLALGSLYVSGDYDAGSPTATFFLGRRFNMLLSSGLTFFLWLMIYGLAKNMFATNPKVAGLITVLYLALFLVALVAKEQVPTAYLVVLLIGGALGAYAILNTSINPALLNQTKGWHALNRTLGIRSAAFGFNVIGSFVVIVGAIQSAISLFRKQILRERAIGNLLIAAGVFIVAGGGTVGGLLGIGGQAAISIPMAFGVTIMYAGFLQAGKPAKPPAGD